MSAPSWKASDWDATIIYGVVMKGIRYCPKAHFHASSPL